MNPIEGEEESGPSDDSTRQDIEELIAMLDGYKQHFEREAKAKSDSTLPKSVPTKECVAKANFVEKMVLIKRKSFPQLSTNGCCNNRLDDGEVLEKILEDDEEKKEIEPESHASRTSAGGENSACSIRGNINLADLDEMITLINDYMIIKEDNKEGRAVDDSQAHRLTLVEEILMEKRKSNHANAPVDVCVKGFVMDSDGIARKVFTVGNKKSPK